MKRMAMVLWLALPAAVAAQEAEDPRTLTVSATAEVEREPDQATLSLAVETEGETAAVAAQRNAEAMEAVVAAIRGAGIARDRIRTQGYQLHPVYARATREDVEPRITGYRALNTVRVEIDSIARVGRVIDAAIGAGANRVSGLVFGLRDYESAQREALQRAVEMARVEAEVIASAAGERLGPPLSIHSGGVARPVSGPMYDMRAMAVEAMAAPTPVEGGTLTVMASVTIVYRLESQ